MFHGQVASWPVAAKLTCLADAGKAIFCFLNEQHEGELPNLEDLPWFFMTGASVTEAGLGCSMCAVLHCAAIWCERGDGGVVGPLWCGLNAL